ncbi:MAG TPA: SDR family oxidoreductase [Cyclobacteriaceae bacterium]|nr:SDR family oxidoreductase [Cyclobacteriaceae bacterium]MCB9237069.1 SDR family oxidoreductase [Flammeovirgaceae bacterium]MCB0500203.1 SDR family oxidoreductase [Cyclobacteriaceae bacterium]MCO5271716.1 SDR family oxidoreductase [Cyclobacteriaceae bacterium]MCW5901220.1 SDR family oxidoreductase [Cyclobacteriaceae bacterium]
MPYFKNKVAWITGASSGIGEALAYELSRRGARLVLSARRKEELEKVKGNCGLSVQDNIKILPLDLSAANTLQLSAAAAIQAFGRIDLLINNGGVSQRSLAMETSLEVDRKVMEVNYFGTIAITKFLLPQFLKQKGGHIAVVTSLTGKFGTPYRSGYAAAKHALHGFFDSLRAELWKENIKVTLIAPGFVQTKISVSALTGDGSRLNEMDEAQRNGMPVAKAAKQIANGIARQKNEVYIGGREVLGAYVKRFFPGLFNKIIRKAKVR